MLTLQSVFRKINAVAKKNKLPVYVVGGFVRDFLRGQPEKKDVDFVVIGSGLTFAKLLDKNLKQTGSLVEFPDFDTARYVIKNKKSDSSDELVLEFAGARSEKYRAHSRKPAVAQATLEEDLCRRDFTVNAMAAPVSVWAGLGEPTVKKVLAELQDPFGGQKDLAAKILRTPLEPAIARRLYDYTRQFVLPRSWDFLSIKQL